MKTYILRCPTALLLMLIMLCASCANAQDSKYLGGLTPEKALSIMKEQPDVYIIDVRENEWYDGCEQFVGNHHIPNSEIEERLDEIPSDKVVILRVYPTRNVKRRGRRSAPDSSLQAKERSELRD